MTSTTTGPCIDCIGTSRNPHQRFGLSLEVCSYLRRAHRTSTPPQRYGRMNRIRSGELPRVFTNRLLQHYPDLLSFHSDRCVASSHGPIGPRTFAPRQRLFLWANSDQRRHPDDWRNTCGTFDPSSCGMAGRHAYVCMGFECRVKLRLHYSAVVLRATTLASEIRGSQRRSAHRGPAIGSRNDRWPPVAHDVFRPLSAVHPRFTPCKCGWGWGWGSRIASFYPGARPLCNLEAGRSLVITRSDQHSCCGGTGSHLKTHVRRTRGPHHHQLLSIWTS